MELETILLLAAAAAIHASWNLLSKQALDKQVFLWLVTVAAGPLFLVPALLAYEPIGPAGWLFVLASGALQVLYTLLLGRAYQQGDLSLVYPLARGSAILAVTVLGALALGEGLTPGGALGIALVAAGIYTVHLRALDLRSAAGPLRALREPASWSALLTGAVIASYSTVDKVGVAHAPPFVYVYLGLQVCALLLAPLMLRRRAAIVAEWRNGPLRILAVAAMNLLAYTLVLVAMQSSRVSYVASVREMSVVFAAALGTLVLREPFGRQKVAGALLIFAGIVSIAAAKG
ncbi:MAG TPA: EamA family transporter [Roseiflexaceae bacterium]|nr:EamA family transporter [Roseiflexaceae bacterium]